MAVSANTLFRNSHLDVPDVIKYVFQIFGSQWQVYLLLTLAQVGCAFLATYIYYFGVLFVVGYEVAQAINSLDADRNIRFLVEHVTGSSGGGSTTRLLEDSYSYYGGSGDVWGESDDAEHYYGFNQGEDFAKFFDALAEAAPGVLIGFSIATLVFLIAASMISSTFSGAMIRVTSEIYAGSSATFSQAIEHGWKMCFNILGYRIIYGIGMIACTIVVLILPMAASTMDPENNIPLFLFLYLVLLMIFIVASCVLIVGEPSIIVEKQSIIGSFKRAFGLSKSKICLIFCCTFCLKLIEFIIYLVTLKIAGFFALIAQLIMSPFFAIMATILYITLRMQSEEFTQNDLAEELSLSHPHFAAISKSVEPVEEEPMSKQDGYVQAQVV